MPCNVALVCLAQIALVVIGWVALGIVLKWHMYPDGDPFIRWLPLTVWLREHGWWLFAIPAITAVLGSFQQSDDEEIWAWPAAGLAMAFVAFCLFLYAAVFPFTRKLLYHEPPGAESSGDTTADRSLSP